MAGNTSLFGKLLRAGVCAAAISVATPAHADGAAAIDEAYGAYRSASNYLRTENAGLAMLDLGAAIDAWKTVADAPAPAALAKDPRYANDVARIGAALNDGMAKAENGDTKAALAAIEPVREILFDLRRRNGLDTYPDCITELNAAMEDIYVYRRPEPDMSKPAVVDGMRSASARYQKLLAKCRSMAPASVAGSDEFKRLFDGTEKSVASMFPAIESGSANAVINVIRELRSFDRIVFFRFGG